MRYSLLSRFKGGLFGSIMVETLFDREDPLRLLSPWTGIGMCAIESLISSGKLDRNNWLNQIEQDGHGQSLLEAKNTANSSQTALATLPIAMFYHENPSLLRHNLELSTAIWQDPSSSSEDVLVWGYTLALALTEQLNPRKLIAQIIAYLGTARTPLRQQLEMVQKFLDSQTNLRSVVTELSRQRKSHEISIALALYCFCCTPEEVGLCLMRARYAGEHSHIVGALTGALAGVYNSYNGIPVAWRHKICTHPQSRDMCQKAELLFAVWSGVYESASTFLPRSLAITSPSRINSDGGKVALF